MTGIALALAVFVHGIAARSMQEMHPDWSYAYRQTVAFTVVVLVGAIGLVSEAVFRFAYTWGLS